MIDRRKHRHAIGSERRTHTRHGLGEGIGAEPLHGVAVLGYGGAIELLGYDFRRMADGVDRYAITYYWKCVGPIWADYAVFAHFARSEDGKVVAWQDHRFLDGAYPPTRWRPGEVFSEQYDLHLEGGSYRLKIGLYRPETSAHDALHMLHVTSASERILVADRIAAFVGSVNAQ